MAWCRQATSHYMNQWWPRNMSPCRVTGPQGVKHVTYPCPYIAYIPWLYYGYPNQGHSWYGLSQWIPRLHCNVVSHWLNQYPDPFLLTYSWDPSLGCMGYSLCVLNHIPLILLKWWRLYIRQLFLTCMKLPQRYGYRFVVVWILYMLLSVCHCYTPWCFIVSHNFFLVYFGFMTS